MTWDNIVTGVITGIIASIIIIVVQSIHEYLKRKSYEQSHIYEFELFDIDKCAPPEYVRESCNSGNTKVKMVMPFDMRYLQVYIGEECIYFDQNIPAESPVYICCFCDLFGEDKKVAFTMTCETSMHEEREYEYKRIYTSIGKPITYALVLKRQRYRFKRRKKGN